MVLVFICKIYIIWDWDGEIMKEWTKKQIDEAEYYGVSLFNRNGIPIVTGKHF